MAAWRLARSLAAARDAFNVRFPKRDRTTDGTIGDAAHQREPSGHNPDDTPGSLPESEDADNEPEVRALDVDADLNEPGVTMWDVVQAILATPADRDRLLYIIHNRKIWSKSQGWRERAYTGSNPHTSHVHLSGDPAYDEDTRPWKSILDFGRSTREGDMIYARTETDATVWASDGMRRRPIRTEAGIVGGFRVVVVVPDEAALTDLCGPPESAAGPVDVAALAREVAKLLPAPPTAKQIVDELRAWLSGK